MPKEDNCILKYDHGEKSMKILFIIYADMESLLDKIDTCHSNPEKSSIIKINKHAASCYSLFTHCSSDVTKNKHDNLKFRKNCENLKERATKIISYEKKE